MRKKTHDEDEDENGAEDGDESPAARGAAAEYQFAGYDIEFSEKIVLMAPQAQPKDAAK